jgi:hypothetical protein
MDLSFRTTKSRRQPTKVNHIDTAGQQAHCITIIHIMVPDSTIKTPAHTYFSYLTSKVNVDGQQRIH